MLGTNHAQLKNFISISSFLEYLEFLEYSKWNIPTFAPEMKIIHLFLLGILLIKESNYLISQEHFKF